MLYQGKRHSQIGRQGAEKIGVGFQAASRRADCYDGKNAGGNGPLVPAFLLITRSGFDWARLQCPVPSLLLDELPSRIVFCLGLSWHVAEPLPTSEFVGEKFNKSEEPGASKI